MGPFDHPFLHLDLNLKKPMTTQDTSTQTPSKNTKSADTSALVTRRVKRISLTNQRHTSFMNLGQFLAGMMAAGTRELREHAESEVKLYFISLINTHDDIDFSMTPDNTSLAGVILDPIEGVTKVSLVTVNADFNIRTGEVTTYKNPVEVQMKLA